MCASFCGPCREERSLQRVAACRDARPFGRPLASLLALPSRGQQRACHSQLLQPPQGATRSEPSGRPQGGTLRGQCPLPLPTGPGSRASCSSREQKSTSASPAQLGWGESTRGFLLQPQFCLWFATWADTKSSSGYRCPPIDLSPSLPSCAVSPRCRPSFHEGVGCVCVGSPERHLGVHAKKRGIWGSGSSCPHQSALSERPGMSELHVPRNCLLAHTLAGSRCRHNELPPTRRTWAAPGSSWLCSLRACRERKGLPSSLPFK